MDSGYLTRQGFEWLKIALDPFHDRKIDGLAGLPDKTIGTSVVSSIALAQEVSVPSGTGTWSFRVQTHPIAYSHTQSIYGLTGTTMGVATGLQPLFPVSVEIGAGDAQFPDNGLISSGLSLPQAVLSGPFKIIGMGIEIVNTTAELYKSGLVTVAVINQSNMTPFTAKLHMSDSLFTVASVFPVRCNPRNLAEMNLIPGAGAWEAKEGLYSVVNLTSFDWSPPTINPQYPVFLPTDLQAGAFSTMANVAGPGLNNVVIPNMGAHVIPRTNPGIVPMNTTTAIFSGLTEQSSFTLRVRWIIERFPSDSQPDIISLATPTAPYDPVALEIYTRVMRRLPPGVMFKENPGMEWWGDVLNNIAKTVATGLSLTGNPIAMGAGELINFVRKTIRDEDKDQKAIQTIAASPQIKTNKSLPPYLQLLPPNSPPPKRKRKKRGAKTMPTAKR